MNTSTSSLDIKNLTCYWGIVVNDVNLNGKQKELMPNETYQ
jgi:hypothetical protein